MARAYTKRLARSGRSGDVRRLSRPWDLVADGTPIVTRSSRLMPVRRHGSPAMLKVAIEAEETSGGVLMGWWEGEGAARVLAQDGGVLLLERAENRVSLADLARNGRDDETTRIICATIARLHAPKARPLPDLLPLRRRFDELASPAATCFATY